MLGHQLWLHLYLPDPQGSAQSWNSGDVQSLWMQRVRFYRLAEDCPGNARVLFAMFAPVFEC